MKELELIVSCLTAIDGERNPNEEAARRVTALLRKDEDAAFHKWLKTMPEALQLDIEENAASLGIAWQDDGYERGFIAGARLMIQIMTGCTQVV